jgi:Uma2 family endonuclease
VSAADRLAAMTMAEFLAWNPQDSDQWELIDGSARAMAPAAPRHGAIPSEVGRLIGNHLAELRPNCRVVTEPGIEPKVRANLNIRVPDLAVTCTSWGPDDRLLREPLVVIEIMSPSNKPENLGECLELRHDPKRAGNLVLHTAQIRADLLRRDEDGAWSDNPLTLTPGDVVTLESIDFTAPIAAFYRTA